MDRFDTFVKGHYLLNAGIEKKTDGQPSVAPFQRRKPAELCGSQGTGATGQSIFLWVFPVIFSRK